MGLLRDVEQGEDGIRTLAGYDEAEDNFVFRREMDVEPILKRNRELYNDGTEGYGPTREWRRAATIPNIFLEKWYREEGIRYWDSEDTPKLMAKLDDPEWKWLRNAPGHLGRKPYRHFYRGSTT